MGYFIRHIHNRDLATENIVSAYCRVRLILDAAPGSLDDFITRIDKAGYKLPSNSVLRNAGEAFRLRHDLPGEYGVLLKPSRRKSQTIESAAVSTALRARVMATLRKWGHPANYRPAPEEAWLMMTGGNAIMT